MSEFIPVEYQCSSKFCKIYNHWLNPFGNYNEPNPYPEKRRIEANNSILHPNLWWAIRNPFHNFCHYWIGVTPLGQMCEWITLEERGWVHNTNPINGNWQYSYWTKPNSKIKLPFWNFDNGKWQIYFGWLSRGNFGLAFRKI